MFETPDIIIIILLIVNIFLIYFSKSSNNVDEQFQKNREETNKISKENREETNRIARENREEIKQLLKDIQESIHVQIKDMKADSSKQLDKIRNTVDEKLQTTLEKKLTESFKQVSERLEQVHEGLGKMQNIAAGVGDLKNILTNPKSKGMFGEYQLEYILEQLLAPDQYSRNEATKKGSRDTVEFAIKLPGNDGNHIWLPVDSKFPSKKYEILNDLYDGGDREEILAARKVLVRQIESEAKTISEKYIDPPNTTDFAIMFLPVEGLYAEVLREPGFMVDLQNKYRVTITGPTTLSAFLNSLHMGFRTLAIQEKSGEIAEVLRKVREQFMTFVKYLNEVDKSFSIGMRKLETLRTTRVNAMDRSLRKVDAMDSSSDDVLQIPNISKEEKSENE